MAVEMCKSKNYDLIFMDMQMPEMGGVEATSHILSGDKKESSPIVIAMTANVLEEDKQKCFSAGMTGFLSKPIKRTEVLRSSKIVLTK